MEKTEPRPPKSTLELAKTIERMYDRLRADGAPADTLNHVWQAAVGLRAKYLPDELHFPAPPVAPPPPAPRSSNSLPPQAPVEA